MLTQLFCLHLYQNKFKLDSHAGLAESQEFFCVDRHFIVEGFRYIKNNVDLSRVPGEPFSYLAVKLLEKSHKGLEVDPLQDTDASNTGFIYPDTIIRCFPDENFTLIHCISVLFLFDSISHLTSFARERLAAAIISICSWMYSRRNTSSMPSASFSSSCCRSSRFSSSFKAWGLLAPIQVFSTMASIRSILSMFIFMRRYSGLLNFSSA